MPKLKNLSGQELIKLLSGLGFIISTQRGSHIKLLRLINGSKQTLTIPNHKNIDKGTLKAIIRQASRYVSTDDLNKIFYTE